MGRDVTTVAFDVGPLHGTLSGVGVATQGMRDALLALPDVQLVPYVLSARATLQPGVRRLPLPAGIAHRAWALRLAATGRSLAAPGRGRPRHELRGATVAPAAASSACTTAGSCATRTRSGPTCAGPATCSGGRSRPAPTCTRRRSRPQGRCATCCTPTGCTSCHSARHRSPFATRRRLTGRAVRARPRHHGAEEEHPRPRGSVRAAVDGGRRHRARDRRRRRRRPPCHRGRRRRTVGRRASAASAPARPGRRRDEGRAPGALPPCSPTRRSTRGSASRCSRR